MRRRLFLKSLCATAAFSPNLPSLGAAPDAPAGDLETLAQARDAIPRLRQAPVTVRVHDWNGQPLGGAAVRSEQQRHGFLFGCNGFMLGYLQDPFLESAYRHHFASLFSSATLGFYWHTYEPRRGEPRHPHMDEVVSWCRACGITCQGAPLTWASLPDPRWLPEDFQEIYHLSHERVREIVSRFQGRFDVWHVVNEPSLLAWADTRFGRWAQSAGTVPYASGYLRTARAADPTATLLVNEVLTEMPCYSLLDRLRDESGTPLFDAVGIQSHMHVTRWPLQRARSVCEEYSRLGRPVHFTEVTVLSAPGREGHWSATTPDGERAQAEYVERLYTTLFGHPAVQAISWWDFSDRGAWKGAAAGLLRTDMTPKPAYQRLQTLLRQTWWTRAQGTTDAAGRFDFRAFAGQHRVNVRLADGREAAAEFTCHAGQARQVNLTLPRWAS